MAGNIEDISALTADVTDLQEELTLVESEQIIQDERILDLEIDNNSTFAITIIQWEYVRLFTRYWKIKKRFVLEVGEI